MKACKRQDEQMLSTRQEETQRASVRESGGTKLTATVLKQDSELPPRRLTCRCVDILRIKGGPPLGRVCECFQSCFIEFK